MKIILAMVASIDGKTTKWNESKIHEWTSKEDQLYFSSLIQRSRVVIMGRKTFDAAREIIRLSPKILRIVITKRPSEYADASVSGQLEFTKQDPKSIIKNLVDRGFSEALLVGGGEINTEFFRIGAINELWLTIEPKILGSGHALVSSEKMNVDLVLQSIDKLNENGTLLLKYGILS